MTLEQNYPPASFIINVPSPLYDELSEIVGQHFAKTHISGNLAESEDGTFTCIFGVVPPNMTGFELNKHLRRLLSRLEPHVCEVYVYSGADFAIIFPQKAWVDNPDAQKQLLNALRRIPAVSLNRPSPWGPFMWQTGYWIPSKGTAAETVQHLAQVAQDGPRVFKEAALQLLGPLEKYTERIQQLLMLKPFAMYGDFDKTAMYKAFEELHGPEGLLHLKLSIPGERSPTLVEEARAAAQGRADAFGLDKGPDDGPVIH